MRGRLPHIRSPLPSIHDQVTGLIRLAVWAIWKIPGSALRPPIRAELNAFDVTNLSIRVPEPSGRDETTRLARTINTSLRRLEHAEGLEQADERLRRTLDQHRQFVADAGHELRTPLAGLRTQLEEAQLHPDDTDLRHLLDRALCDINRLQAVVADLLLLAMIDGNAPRVLEEMDMAELVRTELPRRIGDPHRVRIHLEPGIRVTADRTQISRVLANLLDNAQVHAAHTVRIDVRPNGDSAELAVTDDGKGIAESDRERIFQRFARLDTARSRDRGGSGLGLAIARDIARAHSGSLHVEDAPGDGARFVLRLPRS